ncbi:MAG: PPOX class F420-dependent oxidoreductase, partial [Chloroflexia bacterium]|nr:PPOX class F420-dependent oxidoreductase [Chloroflexia bacterium]
DAQREVINSTPVVALSTVGPKGTPQTTATWFLLDDDGLVRISLNGARQKVRNLQRNPAVSALFVNPQNPFQTVELRGTATVTEEGSRALVDKVKARYDTDVSGFDQPGETRYVVTIQPEKVLTFGL